MFTQHIKTHKKIAKRGKYVLYVCSRDQRVSDNIALNYAIDIANKKEIPIKVFFNLYPKVKNRVYQHYEFMLRGIAELSSTLQNKGINFYFRSGSLVKNIKNFTDVDTIVFDFSPLKSVVNIKKRIIDSFDTNIFEVDTHNIIPVWYTSQKEEFGAYTIRPKIYRLINQFLNEDLLKWQNPLFRDKINLKTDFKINPSKKELLDELEQLNLEKPITLKFKFDPGESEAKKILRNFLDNGLVNYHLDRNDPSKNNQSNLSLYLHYGQISSLRVVLEVLKKISNKKFFWMSKVLESDSEIEKSIKVFLEELVVRKELSDNYCYYNYNYDNINGAKPWARETLQKHLKDKREYIYSIEELESCKTHDDIWNSAQYQLITQGKIHGYMRMYWAKKFLEWSQNPSEAIERAIYLNDKFSIDGYDPNGYTGIMWSICGIHDRAWFERSIFGKIRYMSYNSLKKKYNLDNYIFSKDPQLLDQ